MPSVLGGTEVEWKPYRFDGVKRLIDGWESDDIPEVIDEFVESIGGNEPRLALEAMPPIEAYRITMAITNFLAMTRLASLRDTAETVEDAGE